MAGDEGAHARRLALVPRHAEVDEAGAAQIEEPERQRADQAELLDEREPVFQVGDRDPRAEDREVLVTAHRREAADLERLWIATTAHAAQYAGRDGVTAGQVPIAPHVEGGGAVRERLVEPRERGTEAQVVAL